MLLFKLCGFIGTRASRKTRTTQYKPRSCTRIGHGTTERLNLERSQGLRAWVTSPLRTLSSFAAMGMRLGIQLVWETFPVMISSSGPFQHM